MSPCFRAAPKAQTPLSRLHIWAPPASARKCRSDARPRRNVVDRRFLALARAADALQGLVGAPSLPTTRATKARQGRPSRSNDAGDGEKFAVRPGLRIGPGAGLARRPWRAGLRSRPVRRAASRSNHRPTTTPPALAFGLIEPVGCVVDEPRQRNRTATGQAQRRRGEARRPPNATGAGPPAKTLRVRPAEGLSSAPRDLSVRIWSIFTLNALSSSDFTEAEDPFALFRAWFAEAAEKEINDPDAITLATVDAAGLPDARAMLCKQVDERGFRLLHQRRKRQGRRNRRQPQGGDPLSLEVVAPPGARPRAAGEDLRRRVRTPISPRRPRLSRIGAWASQQSRPLESRAKL